jgi:F420-non-reducing hydrogenase iron-sulfur subunit
LLGLGEERLRLEWVSAAEGGRFAQLIKEFVEDVKKVGPSPLRNSGKEKEKAEIKSTK